MDWCSFKWRKNIWLFS